MLPPTDAVRISRLTAHTRSREQSPSLKNRLSLLIGGADLHPANLPPALILVIKNLVDPLPGRWRDRRTALRTSPEWDAALRESIAKSSRTAARPLRGFIAPDCEAVLFVDEAEWIACLAFDLAKRRVLEHWWWRGIHKSLPELGPLLAENARFLPAAVDTMDRWGITQSVVDSMDAEDARWVAECMTKAFDISVDFGRRHNRHEGSVTIGLHSFQEERLNASIDSLFPSPDPAGEAEIHRAMLVGLARVLSRQPRLAAEPSFVLAVDRWRIRQERRAGRGSAPGGGAGRVVEQPSPRSGSTPSDLFPASSDEGSLEGWRGKGDPGRAENEPKVEALRRIRIDSENSVCETPGGEESAPAFGTDEKERECLLNREGFGDRPSTADQEAPASTSDEEIPGYEGGSRPTTTGLGGCFYLVNVMLRDNLPARLSPWEMLEALTWKALGLGNPSVDLDGPGRFAEDPLWACLRELDRRALDCPPSAEVWTWANERWRAWEIRLRPLLGHGDRCEIDRKAGKWAPLLCHRARVHLTPAHLDVIFHLNEISLAIRRAGLDRDPGWCPDFGRVIRFHYH